MENLSLSSIEAQIEEKAQRIEELLSQLIEHLKQTANKDAEKD